MSNSNHRDTDVVKFLEDLDGGVFVQKIARALSDVAAGVVDNNKDGKVALTFDISRIGNSYQTKIKHRIQYTVPEERGKVTTENTTESAMHVGTGGRLSIFPEDQGQMFTRSGEPQPTKNEE